MKNKQSIKPNLKVTHPEIAKMAFGWDPSEVTYGSKKIREWICKKGHIWSVQVRYAKSGCVFCSNRSVLIGFNDLLFTHPEIAKELQNIDPQTITITSIKSGNWKCNKGHLWKVPINRRKQAGCEICNRNNLKVGNTRTQPFSKNKLADDRQIRKWLVNKSNGALTSGSRKVIEWKCPEGHIFNQRVQDFVLTKVCSFCSGNKILRGLNDLATLFPEIAAEAYGWDPTKKGRSSKQQVSWKCKEGHIYKSYISDRTRQVRFGKKDYKSINCSYCSNKKVLKGFNDLKTTHPDLCKNIILGDPEMVTAGSEKVFTWICEKGHHFKYQIFRRTSKQGGNCQVCDGTIVLAGFNDLKTIHPELCRELVIGDPEKVTAHSNKKFTWKCSSGHQFRSSISARTRVNPKPSGCPKCAKYGFSSVDDGWLYLIKHFTWGLLQIGISNHPEERIKYHESKGWEILDLRGPMDGELTRQIETDLLRFLGKRQIRLDQIDYGSKFSGYTESWIENDFPITSLQAFIELSDKDQ